MKSSRNPAAPASRSLRQLAGLHGIQTTYIDMAKRRQFASVESLLAVLRALGAEVVTLRDVPAALRQARLAHARQVLEPVNVVWRGRRTKLTVQLPAQKASGVIRSQWKLEDGRTQQQDVPLGRLRPAATVSVAGETFVQFQIAPPPRLPAGYHDWLVESAGSQFRSRVLVAPERCYAPPTQRKAWGVFAPLYALHSAGSWGAGDFGDLAQCMSWLARLGGRLLATLPLLPAYLDQPCDPSPYSPVSRLFWNEFYLDLEQVPELSACPAAQKLLQSAGFQKRTRQLRQSSLVQYRELMALKRQVLELLARKLFASSSARRRELAAFVRRHPRVEDYACFRATMEQRRAPWTDWPQRLRQGELRERDYRASSRRYHVYVQWLAHEQMTHLTRHAAREGVQLYLDMPLGVHRAGYDTWRHQELFALDAAGGSPPDPVFTQGQDWGFAPLHPQRSRAQGHQYIVDYLRHHLAQAGMLRIDHVMGLHRLYWVPQGLPASQGAYVSYPAEELYALLAIESHRHRAVIAGENLGTVPPVVNRALKRHRLAELYVAQYEFQPTPKRSLRRVPANAVASLNTHDMPPFQAYWQGLDIADRRDLGLLRRSEVSGERRLRDRVRRALVKLLRQQGWLPRGARGSEEILPGALAFLSASAAWFVLVNLEDLWRETHSQNVPGTEAERINWRRKLRFSLEQLRQQPEVLARLRWINELRR